jgi:hypothetical protein
MVGVSWQELVIILVTWVLGIAWQIFLGAVGVVAAWR